MAGTSRCSPHPGTEHCECTYLRTTVHPHSGSKMKDFGGDTPYSIMFGPDICGYGTRRVHVIFTWDGTNYLIKKTIPCKTDRLSHIYTLIVRPNNTYEVRMTKTCPQQRCFFDTPCPLRCKLTRKRSRTVPLRRTGRLFPPRKSRCAVATHHHALTVVQDPEAKKPDDWDERKQIPDPEDKKPEGWDDIPATIVDDKATKPEDWDDEEDGEWEPPTLPNPEYKGEWKQKMMDNPDYKGIWEAPDIDNPEYKPNPDLYIYPDSKYVGFELWQVKAGTIFDNIIVTDSLEEANKFADSTWGKNKVLLRVKYC